MASTIRKMRGQVFVKQESAADTYTAPAASDAFLAQDIEYSILEGEAFQRSELRGNFNKMDPVPGPAGAQITFTVLLRGAGSVNLASGLAPEYGEALKGCGFREVIESGVSAQYQTTTECDGAYSESAGAGIWNPGPSYTVEFLEDGLRRALKGGWGNVTFQCEAGRPVQAQFTFQGAYMDIVDKALVADSELDFQETTPPTFLSAGVTIPVSGTTMTPVFETLTYDLGNEVNLRKNANDAAGIVGAKVSDRRPVGSIDPEEVLPGTSDIWGAWRIAEAASISTGIIGSVSGNRIRIQAPRCVYRAIAPADRNNVRTLGLDFDVTSAPDDGDNTAFIVTIS